MPNRSIIHQFESGEDVVYDGFAHYPICFPEVDVTNEDAIEAARAILQHAGQVGTDAVLASDISFNEAVLRLAAVHERVVEFRYAKGTGDVIETRSLVPQEVRQVGDHLTFVGYDPDRDDVRAYRVDRMKGEVTVR